MTADIQTRQEQAPAVRSEAAEVMALFQQAIDKGTSPESLEKLVMLHERVTRRQAELEFARDLAEFQATCPAIPRSSVVDYASGSGKRVTFNYASFEDIMRTMRPHATPFGFSFTFSTDMAGQTMVRTCTLRHRNGHSISATAPITTNNSNPGMSEQQKWAAAETSASRRALVSILGLAMTDDSEAEEGSDGTAISEEHATTLAQMLSELKPPDVERFWKYMSAASGREVTKPGDLREVQFGFAVRSVRALEQERKGGAKS